MGWFPPVETRRIVGSGRDRGRDAIGARRPSCRCRSRWPTSARWRLWLAGLAYAVDGNNAVTVYHTDGLGSVRAITNGSGAVVQTYRSDAFGVATSTQGGSLQPFGYTGQPVDPESGLSYLHARYYAPTLGRFLQRDPLGGSPAAPLSLNRYSYALNNPASRTDPSGLSSSRATNDNHLSPCWDPTGMYQTNCPGPGQVNCFYGGQCLFVPTIAKIFCAFFDCGEGGGGSGAFSNKLPERLSGELATARRLGVVPLRVGDAGFAEAVNAGTVKWVVTTDGQLLVIPKYVGETEIAHTVLTGGRPVLAAGEADIAAEGNTYVGLDINNHSGHYEPSPESLSIGRAAFAKAGITFP